MINGKFNFILKVMFWITRQPINQVIDNPDSVPQKQEWGGQQVSSLFSKEDEFQFFVGINHIHALFHCYFIAFSKSTRWVLRPLELKAGPGLWADHHVRVLSGDALLAHGHSSGGTSMPFIGGGAWKKPVAQQCLFCGLELVPRRWEPCIQGEEGTCDSLELRVPVAF